MSDDSELVRDYFLNHRRNKNKLRLIETRVILMNFPATAYISGDSILVLLRDYFTRFREHLDHFPVFTRLSINPAPLPPPTLHSLRRFHSIDIGSFLTDLKSSQLIIDPPKSLGPLLITYSIPSTWQTYSDRHQTLQASFSIKSMVYSNPTRLSIQPPPCMPKTLETHTLCCWLVLLQVSPQPIPEAHPVFEKVNYCSLVTSASDNPQGSRRLNLQVHNNFSVNYIGWKFQREFSSGYVFSRIVALSARRRHTLLRSCTWLPT